MEKFLNKFSDLAIKGFGNEQMGNLGIWSFVIILLVSLFSSLFISYLYLKFYRNRATGSQIHRAFPVLGISITAIFICIQFSLPLSLGLLGALSIVRFRTPIKEPEEIAFIMLLVASSISCGTFNFTFLGIILAVSYLALIFLKKSTFLFKDILTDGMLVVTLQDSESINKIDEIIQFIIGIFPEGKIESISNTNNQSIISYSFTKVKKTSSKDFTYELKRIAPDASSNIFINRLSNL